MLHNKHLIPQKLQLMTTYSINVILHDEINRLSEK
jgi:hypothetical protein